MGKTKSEWRNISIDRWIALLSGAIAVIGWALLIWVNLPKPISSQPPSILDFQLSREMVPAGETVEARVVVNDPNLPDDEIHYFWAAQLGRIGKQLDRFEGPQVTYVAPEQTGVDFITVVVHDREGRTDRDFKTITVTERKGRQVIIGNKNFTEQYIVGQLMKQLFEDHGFSVKLDSDNYSEVLRRKMEDGEIDICADYTGTIFTGPVGRIYEPGMDNNEIYGLVKEAEEHNGFIWLKPIWNNNTYALASWPEYAEERGLKTLSDLAALCREQEGEITVAVDPSFLIRPDGLPGLEKHYEFKIKEAYILIRPPEKLTEALLNKECDVALVFGTHAEIAEYGWHLYMDDRYFFPPYDLTPYVRKGVLDTYPEIVDILSELVATFPGGGGPATPEIVAEGQKVWQELNAKVDIEEMTPEKVANEYLMKHGLIK